MSFDLLQSFTTEMHSISLMLMLINAVIHIIFAGAVARDAGKLVKIRREVYLVSPMTWAFATLLGGVFVAVVFWFMHHLNVRQADDLVGR